MDGLRAAIQRRDVRFPDGPIRHELEAFEYQYTSRGVRYGAPTGVHDDCVIALALAVHHHVAVAQVPPPMCVIIPPPDDWGRPRSWMDPLWEPREPRWMSKPIWSLDRW